MNGNCAGGTKLFLTKWPYSLDVPIDKLNELAEKAEHVHYIASRCGVFAKTDIQNLLSKGVSREDIAASIYHAVAVQVITTLSHGCTIKPKILLCGGPLTFMPSLRKALMDALHVPYVEFIVPDKANLIPAYGLPSVQRTPPSTSLQKLRDRIASALRTLSGSPIRCHPSSMMKKNMPTGKRKRKRTRLFCRP